ncbi:unnamed protein product [Orchesella dallaii]|uniref:Uncharacterized protein n=1 Tax=Orchesella dallaii TaxID=48710 RepID=A0ABP1PXS3_9HEXA
MRIIFASLLLVAYVAIDVGFGLPLPNAGNDVNQPQGDFVSIIDHELLLNILRQWFPSVLYMRKKSQPQVQTLTPQTDQVAANSKTLWMRSEDESFINFFYRVVWGLPVLDGGNAETVNQDRMTSVIKDVRKYFLLVQFQPLFLLDYLQLNNLSPNLLILPPFDRPGEPDTRSKRTADESWTAFFLSYYRAIWPVLMSVLLLTVKYLVGN